MDSFNTGFNQDNYINTLALHQELLENCIFKLNQRNKSQNINYELNYNTIIIYIIKGVDEYIEIPSFNKFIGGLEFKKIKPTELKFVIELIENFKINIEIKYVDKLNNNNQYLIDNLIKENDNLKKELNFKIEENKELKLKIKQLETLKTNYQSNPQYTQTSKINTPKLDIYQDTAPNSPRNYNGILGCVYNYDQFNQESYEIAYNRENINTNSNIPIIKPVDETYINNQQKIQNSNTNTLNQNSCIDLKNIKTRINITYNNIRYNEKIPISYIYNNITYSSEPTFEDLIKYKIVQLYNKEIGATLILKKPEFIFDDYLRNEKKVFIKTYVYPKKYLNSTTKLPNEDIVFKVENNKYIEIKLNQNLQYKLYIHIVLA